MILVAVDTPFWMREDEGAARAAAVIRTVHAHLPDTAVYLGDAIEEAERVALGTAFPGLELHELPWYIKIRRMRRNRFRSIARRLGARTPPGPLMREQREDFMRLCARLRPGHIVCMTPRLGDLIAALPKPRAHTWVDCHGAFVLRDALAPHERLEAEQERERIAHFDALIAASPGDAAMLHEAYPGKRVVIAPEQDYSGLVAALVEAQ